MQIAGGLELSNRADKIAAKPFGRIKRRPVQLTFAFKDASAFRDSLRRFAAYVSHGLRTWTRALSKSLRSRVTTVSPW